jgi:hypothetical protein
MHFDIDIYNSVAAIASAITVFLLGGMVITRKRGR